MDAKDRGSWALSIVKWKKILSHHVVRAVVQRNDGLYITCELKEKGKIFALSS